MVMVSTKNWNTGGPSKKLDYQWAGPFQVLTKEGNAFCIELPASTKAKVVKYLTPLMSVLHSVTILVVKPRVLMDL